MKALNKLFGYTFAVITLAAFFVGLATLRPDLCILAIIMGVVSIVLILHDDDR